MMYFTKSYTFNTALSDLSFALVKNKGTFELGILAKSLQKEEGFL